MKTIVWLLTEVLQTVLRIEHKLDILVRKEQQRVEGQPMWVPSMSHQVTDPVSGTPVKYDQVDLESFGMTVFVREAQDTPQSAQLPKVLGEEV